MFVGFFLLFHSNTDLGMLKLSSCYIIVGFSDKIISCYYAIQVDYSELVLQQGKIFQPMDFDM